MSCGAAHGGDRAFRDGIYRVAWWLAALTLACSSTDPGLEQASEGSATPAGLLAVPPLVGRPTADSVTLNLVAGPSPVDLELRLEPPGSGELSLTLEAEEARDVVLDGLAAGSEYRYTIAVRGEDQTTGARSENLSGRFVTQRPPGAEFTFAVLTDTHQPVPPPEWLDRRTTELFLPEIYDYLASRVDIGDVIRRTMRSIQEREVDFIVCLGDMFHFFRGFNDPFPTATTAEYAYLDLRAHFGQATAEAAFFAAVGNWEGESGWHPDTLRSHAQQARLKYLLNPEGSPNEDYFAWSWGDALFVVLNVSTYTPTRHIMDPEDDGTATDWTLGDTQRAWLEATLRTSDAPIKLLFIHHAVGGHGGDEPNSAYGRGGGRAARVGEQARIHQLMLEHGVQIFFYGHDHVFTDQIVDGIHYTLPG
ncbi:MAG: metallophosphoesterase, partial [Acidobacteriota bacterium]